MSETDLEQKCIFCQLTSVDFKKLYEISRQILFDNRYIHSIILFSKLNFRQEKVDLRYCFSYLSTMSQWARKF